MWRNYLFLILAKNLPTEAKSRLPQQVYCSGCSKEVKTMLSYKIGAGTCVLGLVISCVGCLPLSCIPCFLNDYKDVIHKCPNCSNFLGKRGYMFD